MTGKLTKINSYFIQHNFGHQYIKIAPSEVFSLPYIYCDTYFLLQLYKSEAVIHLNLIFSILPKQNSNR